MNKTVEDIMQRYKYQLDPQEPYSLSDIMDILRSLEVRMDQSQYDALPDNVKRHFIDQTIEKPSE